MVLANLAEGTFPTRDAVESAEDADDPASVGRAFAREMAQFLRVIGSAGDGLVLAYPTRDEKGQEVLPAGFLDDLKRRIDPEALAGVADGNEFNRFDPALLDHADLAVAPADARARAVALACRPPRPGRHSPRLATDPAHRPALAGDRLGPDLTAPPARPARVHASTTAA